PLARYEEARAELEANGNVYVPPSSKSKSFFAFLFGGGGEDDEDGPAPAPRSRGRDRPGAAPSRGQVEVAAYAPTTSGNLNDDGSRNFFAAESASKSSPVVARAASNLPRGETYMAPSEPAPPPVAAPAAPEKVQVAAIDPAIAVASAAKAGAVEETADDGGQAAAAPMPPRRPEDLPTFAAFAPLPPARPAEFNALAYNQPLASAPMSRDAIADIIAANRRGDVVGTIARPRGNVGLRTASLAPLPPPRTEIVPARLDRSDFAALTAKQSSAHITTQSVMGSAVGLRSAARARAKVLKPEPQPASSKFRSHPTDLSATKFTTPFQGNLRAALTNVPPTRKN
ncbi:MAG: hypothetical protein KGM42_03620, partial [Hyphomicrobiales bacterium]|nr:hypothetical protein [Hyphomicrobiales bacterium]